MIKRLKIMNLVSAVAFLLSSLCLLIIPFVDLTNGLPRRAYLIAMMFWLGLLLGVGLQIYLKIKCRKMKTNFVSKRYKTHYITALVAFIIFVILAVTKSRSSVAVVGSLLCTIVSLQSVAIIKRRECLK